MKKVLHSVLTDKSARSQSKMRKQAAKSAEAMSGWNGLQ